MITSLITSITAMARAVPELKDLCETLLAVVEDYRNENKKLNARKRWSAKNAAIAAAISDVQRLSDNETEQHGTTDSPSTIQVCRTCGSRLDKGRT